MNKVFKNYLKNNGILIASHRGVYGGNVIENTTEAFEIALNSGVSIIEMDVIKSTDNHYYVFHDTEEMRMFKIDKNIHELSKAEIDVLTYYNRYGIITSRKVETLEEVLLNLKDRCLINLDRIGKHGFDYLKGILEIVKKLKMFDQVIFKTAYNEEIVEGLSEYETKVMYMPIVKTTNEIKEFEKHNLNIVALELVFNNENSELISDENIKNYKDKGYALWMNTICFSERSLLSGKYSDHNLLTSFSIDDMIWILEKGFDVIQTDFPSLIKELLLKAKKRLENID